MTTEVKAAEPGAAEEAHGRKRTLVGKVTSAKMQKTVVVEVVRSVRHPVYGKYVRRRKKYKAHDENNQCRIGDQVRIVESRPYSKDTHFQVAEILNRAAQIDTTPLQAEK